MTYIFFSWIRIFRFLLIYIFFHSLFFPPSIPAKETSNEGQFPSFWKWDRNRESYKIRYIEAGSGPNHIVLIHGFAAHSYTWQPLIQKLSESGYHVWSIDLLGFGLSEKPLDINYTLDLYNEQIQAFMEAKNLSKAAFVGNSLGGGIILSLAMSQPELVQSLVLIDPLVYPIKYPFYFALTKFFGNWTKPFFGKFSTKQVLKDIYYDPNKISNDTIEAYHLPFQTPNGKEAFIKALNNFDMKLLNQLAPHYKNISVPMLIIWGKNDKWMALNYQRKVNNTFPHVTAVSLPNCGHAPQEECPDKVFDALITFYKKNL